jgi:hypothetical protein
MSQSRVLEYTDSAVADQVAPNGVLDLDKIITLPTVFAAETAWDRSQPPARVGTLTQVRPIGRDFQLEYRYDLDVPPIPNEVLFGRLANELGINNTASIPESSRTHWSVKEADLFKVLLQDRLVHTPRPKVFSLSDDPIDSSLVAVMMPFDAAFRPVYDALSAAIVQIDLRSQRADDIWENDHIVQDVALLLSKAAAVVCDLSGRNANVFYETGIAHTLGKEVILIAQSQSDIPFDVAGIRHIRYHPNGEGLAKLQDELKARLTTLKARGVFG